MLQSRNVTHRGELDFIWLSISNWPIQRRLCAMCGPRARERTENMRSVGVPRVELYAGGAPRHPDKHRERIKGSSRGRLKERQRKAKTCASRAVVDTTIG